MTSDNRTPEYVIRACSTIEDFTACIRMQREIWQFADLDITPLRAFIIARHNGGITFGAFQKDGSLLGFSHTLPAFDVHNRPYYYSQMAAVDKRMRNSGIGFRLKLAQRDFALTRGIPLITWTFDPLESRNAHLNIVKLGGVIRTYCVNHYGNVNTSTLDGDLDTDRLVIEWWIRSEHVAQALAGQRRPAGPVAAVEIPAENYRITPREVTGQRLRQYQVRAAFQHHFADGLYCADFERGRNGAPSRYLFFQDDRREVDPSHR